MSDDVFNELLFESPEAQGYFNAMTANLSEEDRQKLRSVLGKPSQFVGRVMNYDQAVAHWAEWDKWNAAEEQRKKVEARKGKPDPAEVTAARDAWHHAVEAAKQDRKIWDKWQKDSIAQIRAQSKFAEAARAKVIEQLRDRYKELRDS